MRSSAADELAFIVHPQSIGHGVDGFQNVCHIIVFFALSHDLDPHDQIIERIGPMRQMQTGLDREVLVYQIVARDTIDGSWPSSSSRSEACSTPPWTLWPETQGHHGRPTPSPKPSPTAATATASSSATPRSPTSQACDG